MLSRGQQNFFLKGQRVNILGFVGQRVCATTPGFCHCIGKAARDNKYINEWAWLCSNKTLFTKTDGKPTDCQGPVFCWGVFH